MCPSVIKHSVSSLMFVTALTACADAAKDGGEDDAQAVNEPAGVCSEQSLEECQAVRQEITQLEADRDAAQDRNDWATVARLSLTINQRHELLDLLQDDAATAEARRALVNKYKALNRMLDRDLKRADGNGVRKAPGMVYNPLEVKAVAAVTKDFGELYIDVTDKDINDGFQELQVAMPWSGYWYPLRGTELFDGEQSPLKKLDQALTNLNLPSGAAEKELENHSLAQADSWEGLCGAWALASASTTEPTEPNEVGGVTFNVLDQKALLTKIFERAPSTFYGIRYFGDAETDGTIQDLRPEAFHNIFTNMLGKQQKSFVIDDDPSVEVWSKPVYRVRWSVTQDPERDDAFLVKAFPWMIRHRERLSESATSLSDRATVVYEYRLFVDKSKKTKTGYRVIAGEWLGDSRNGHPDAAIVPQAGKPASLNPIINASIDLVRRIVRLP